MNSASTALETAMQFHQSGSLERAEELYRHLVSDDPKNAEALHLLGVACLQKGEFREAVAFLERAIAADASMPLYHSNLGAAYRSLADLESAVSCFQRAIQLAPQFVGGRFNLALALEAQGRIEEAMHELKAITELDARFAPASLNRGRLLAASGRTGEAIDCFRNGLCNSPASAELQFNLGNALQVSGRLDDAERAYRQAIKADPQIASCHNNLGLVLNEQGDREEARLCFQRAIELDPEDADARYNLTSILPGDDSAEKSIAAWQERLTANPENVTVLCALAASLQQQGRFEEATGYYEQAARFDPEHAQIQFALGFVYQSQAISEKARDCYERGLQLDGSNSAAWVSLGSIYLTQDRLDDAADCYQNALNNDPADAVAAYNFGNVRKDEWRLEEALELYDRAIKIDPEFSAALINRAVVLKSLGRLDDAVAGFTAAVETGEREAEARFHRSLSLLLQGEFARGWDEYEWRWQYEATPRRFPQPVWEGEPLCERSLLIYAEQGVGDEILFASCLPDVVNRTRACVIECDPRLVPLFARSFPLATVVARPDHLSEESAASNFSCDLQIALGSLPRFCRHQCEDFPPVRRFLAADPNLVSRWQTRLASLGTGLKVGVSWRGGNKPEIRKRRSTTLSDWRPLWEIPGIKFVNLQYGNCRDELETAKREWGVTLHDWDDADPLKDLDSFAAQIAALDLVISIDNSTVHMAGSVGCPVWTLLPVDPNWRWMLERGDSPWYPSLSLFRQTKPLQWGPLFEQVAEELRSYQAGIEKIRVENNSSECDEELSDSDNSDKLMRLTGKKIRIDESPLSEHRDLVENLIGHHNSAEDLIEHSPLVEDLKPAFDDGSEHERRKYEEIWTHDDYRTMSPGLEDADKVQLFAHLRRHGVKTILDAGCGSGKLMQRLITEHSEEFSVHGFDISRNCLDPFFDDIRDEVLTVGCLWNADDMPGEYDAVLCTDVLEHIPTERIPAVLMNLKNCTGKVAYLAVALFPDGFGPKLIGEPLHLTVKPPNWWYARISVAGFRIESHAVEQHSSGQDMWLHVMATV